MIEIACPVLAQKETSPTELLDRIPHQLTEADREDQHLILGDTYTRLSCNVGDCAVMAMLEDRTTGLVHRKTFQVVNASLCQRHEAPIMS